MPSRLSWKPGETDFVYIRHADIPDDQGGRLLGMGRISYPKPEWSLSYGPVLWMTSPGFFIRLA